MRIALDIHGVINTHPEFFSELSKLFVGGGHEIHILTGSHIQEGEIIKELERYGIKYTHLFSIADHHRDKKTPGMWYDKNGNPWVSDEDWDKTKAIYCKEHNISFCIDDTARYANNFETPFGYMSIQMNKEKPNKYLNSIINMFEERRKKSNVPSMVSWFKTNIIWLNKKLSYITHPSSKLGKEEQNSKYR